MFQRISWVITSVQEVAVRPPLVCLPHLGLYTCTPGKGFTGTGSSTVRQKAGCVLRVSYSYIIENGMDEIVNKSHNTFCVIVFCGKQKMLGQYTFPRRSSEKSIATKTNTQS